MKLENVLVVGGGIAGLTAGIALRRKGYSVEMIEKDPDWTVYGVGIIQQFNAIRAMAELDLLDRYMASAYGFDRTRMFMRDGTLVLDINAPRLAGDQFSSNAGIKRTALQKVLATCLQDLGAKIRLGITVDAFAQDADGVNVSFSDGSQGRYDIVVGADGVFSRTRQQIMPDAPTPRYTGQWAWRYNFPQPEDVIGIDIFAGGFDAGLVPIGDDTIYMFLLSQEDADFTLPTKGAAAALRARGTGAPPRIADLLARVTDDEGVVARPLEVIFLDGPWHVGRIVLLGDAVHASTPQLAQGAGMAIEDGIVLAEELGRHDTPDAVFSAFRKRRYARTKFVVETSVRIGDMQMGKIPRFDTGPVMGEMMGLMAQPI